MMPIIVFSLCAATSIACAWLLLRGYRRSGARLLLWSGLCFTGFAINNMLLIVDVVTPGGEFSVLRTLPSAIGLGLLVYGLVWEVK